MNLNYLFLEKIHIYEQLQLEEALLRKNDQNWCIVNTGSEPAIIMGVSGKKEEWIDVNKAKQDQIPLIKRFSGGGTVFADEDTLFVTFIFAKDTFDFEPFPEPIHRWAMSMYYSIFPIKGFALRENDYVIGERKFGGNAQYIRKNRWLYHTTFLWDYKKKNMDYLISPPKSPKYRKNRSHEDFLCTMNQFFPNKQTVIKNIEDTLYKTFQVKKIHSFSIDHCKPSSVQLIML